jgi:hypothetical protein
VCSKTFRKNIAVVKTVLTANQRTALKEHYKGAKYVPIDLRAKKVKMCATVLECVKASCWEWLVWVEWWFVERMSYRSIVSVPQQSLTR